MDAKKPSYLGLLNAIALGEGRAHQYLSCWAAKTPDPDVKQVLLTVAIREGEHSHAFTKRLCELGYADRMVLSHDASCFGSFMDPEPKARLYPDWTFVYLFDTVLPEMRRRGVTQSQLDQMLIDNPRRFFEPVQPY